MTDMADWQITATTVYCADVNDEVTLLIYRDGTVTCTGSDKYSQPGKATAAAMKQKARDTGKAPVCNGGECRTISENRGKWLGG